MRPPPPGCERAAAGVAAALSAKRRVLPSALPVKTLQNALGVNGVPLHLPDVGLAYKQGR